MDIKIEKVKFRHCKKNGTLVLVMSKVNRSPDKSSSSNEQTTPADNQIKQGHNFQDVQTLKDILQKS